MHEGRVEAETATVRCQMQGCREKALSATVKQPLSPAEVCDGKTLGAEIPIDLRVCHQIWTHLPCRSDVIEMQMLT